MQRAKLVVAHRGDHTKARENTLAAFQAAIDEGADAIELDVRRTADGRLVVHHDERIGDQRIADHLFSRASDLASRLGYRLAQLDEVTELAAGRIGLDVELKESGYEQTVLDALRRRLSVETFWITSFLPESLTRVRDADPAVQLGLLVENMSGARALDCFKQARVDFLAPEHTLADKAMLDEARRHRITLLPWVVNDADQIARCLDEPSMLGVITDRLAVAIEVRARNAAR